MFIGTIQIKICNPDKNLQASFAEDKRNIPHRNAANTFQLSDWAEGHKASITQKSRGIYKDQNERWELKAAFVSMGVENSWIKPTQH